MRESFIERTYKSEIDLLPVQTQYYYSINSKKDELVIHERKFKLLPKLKFVRGRDKKIIISESVVERCTITVPFTIEKEKITKDCTKFHSDYVEYEVDRKVYDSSIKEFIESKLNHYRSL